MDQLGVQWPSIHGKAIGMMVIMIQGGFNTPYTQTSIGEPFERASPFAFRFEFTQWAFSLERIDTPEIPVPDVQI